MMANNWEHAVSLGNVQEPVREIVERERGRLLAFIRNRVPSWEEAEDILQDVFFQLANRWDPNEPIEQASAWMFRVARNKITDTYRKKKAVPFSQYHQDGEEGKELYFFEHLPDFSQSPDQIYWQNWVMEAIEEAVEALPTKQKEVFIWHELEDRSFKEIAQMTGELVPTLISRKRYAVRTLRARLLEMYESLWAD